MTLKLIFIFAIVALLFSFTFSQETSYVDRANKLLTENVYDDATPEKIQELRDLAFSADAYNKYMSNPFINREEQGLCFKWHGRYCGPGYCDGKFWDDCSGSNGDQKKCNTNASYSDEFDSCCRAHDRCCINRRNGSSTRCDTPFVNCLNNIKASGLKAVTKKFITEVVFNFLKNKEC